MNNVYKFHVTFIKNGGNLHNAASLSRLLLLCAAAAPDGLPHARDIFSHIHSPDTFTYNTIIRAHAHSSPSLALCFFHQMRLDDIPPDNFTFPFVLKACSRLQIMGQGLHALTKKLGLDSDIYVQNALISGYGSAGSLNCASKLFNEMHERDLVSWSAMIGCYTNCGHPYEALTVFQQMQIENIHPDEVTLLTVISAVSSIGELDLGKWIEMFIRRIGLKLSISLGTALIDMYSRCGSVDDSMKVFDEMPHRNLKTWTAAINGLAVHGRGNQALQIFNEMKKSGWKPDSITISAVLVACSHNGLIDEGWRIFHSIKNEIEMDPKLEHYGCMVDVLGRAGLVHEAYKFIETMPLQPNSIIWRTLLGSCMNNNNIELAEKVNQKILELDPHHDGDYVLLSNLYGSNKRWSEKEQLRSSMRDRKINKRPGCSSVTVDQEVHEFISGDNSHPCFDKIKGFLISTMERLKVTGYVPGTSYVFHDIEEEEKENSLSYHSEKLAVAFALISFEDNRTIRIMKNLRICRDCHSFMKHISVMSDRDIVIRDQNRFHHFSKGCCSCRDYW